MDKKLHEHGPVFWPYVSLVFIIGLLIGLAISSKDVTTGFAYGPKKTLEECKIVIEDEYLITYIQENYDIVDDNGNCKFIRKF